MKATINGVDLAFTDEGRGTPLVFVHGFPLSRGCWRPQWEALAKTHRCLAPDLRGFGDTQSSPGTVTMEQLADDVASLLDARQTGPAVVIGHSMGGYVALAFARHHRPLLRGLVLVATRPGADSPEAAAGRRSTAENVTRDGPGGVIDAMAAKMLAADNDDAQMATEVREMMASATREGVVGALLGMAERPDFTGSLPEIDVPTLVVAGAADIVIPPSESEAMAQAIEGSRLRIIPDAGHLVAYEKAGAFNDEMHDWLGTLPA